jgi:type I restriction enzyme S subunit
MASDARFALQKGTHALPPGWEWRWQDEVFRYEGGAQPPASTFVPDPRPGYVRLVQIRDYYTDSHLTYVPDSPRLHKCTADDVMIARYGSSDDAKADNSLGRVCRGIAGAYNVALAKAVPLDGVSRDFLYYLLQSEHFQQGLRAQGARSVQAGFNRESLSVIALPVPPYPEQIRIAEILGALDDKIDLNRRMSQTLESVTRGLFDRAFGSPQLAVPLGSVVEEVRDPVRPFDFPDRRFDHYSIPAYDELRLPSSELGAQIRSLKWRVHGDEVLLSKLNPEIERVWLPDISPADAAAVCSTEFLVLRPVPPTTRTFLFCLLRSPGFRDQLRSITSGTTGSRQRARPEAISDLLVPSADDGTLRDFERAVAPVVRLEQGLRTQCGTLRAARACLLPQLLAAKGSFALCWPCANSHGRLE